MHHVVAPDAPHVQITHIRPAPTHIRRRLHHLPLQILDDRLHPAGRRDRHHLVRHRQRHPQIPLLVEPAAVRQTQLPPLLRRERPRRRQIRHALAQLRPVLLPRPQRPVRPNRKPQHIAARRLADVHMLLRRIERHPVRKLDLRRQHRRRAVRLDPEQKAVRLPRKRIIARPRGRVRHPNPPLRVHVRIVRRHQRNPLHALRQHLNLARLRVQPLHRPRPAVALQPAHIRDDDPPLAIHVDPVRRAPRIPHPVQRPIRQRLRRRARLVRQPDPPLRRHHHVLRPLHPHPHLAQLIQRNRSKRHYIPALPGVPVPAFSAFPPPPILAAPKRLRIA